MLEVWAFKDNENDGWLLSWSEPDVCWKKVKLTQSPSGSANDTVPGAGNHTRGPWYAATYSSVVGAPIVASSGRPIARVTYFELDKAFDNHKRESEANGRLIAAAPDLLDALVSLKACVISAKGNFSVDDLKAQSALMKANTAISKAKKGMSHE